MTDFQARTEGPCGLRERCLLGGRIHIGQSIKWPRTGPRRGHYYHAQCWASREQPQNGTPSEGEHAEGEHADMPEEQEHENGNSGVAALDSLAVALAPLIEARLKGTSTSLRAHLEEIARQAAAEAFAQHPPTRLEISKPPEPPELIEDAHESLAQLLYWIGQGQHCYLWGPPGSGKSHAARQAAEILRRPYGYAALSPQTPEWRLFGFLSPNGEFQATPFYQIYASGGIFCLDELDNASSTLLCTLNGALSNRVAPFACGMVEASAEFVLIGTGNTSGHGGDWRHPERRPVDESVLDRLAQLHWAYDAQLERALCLQVAPEEIVEPWLYWLHQVRAWADNEENSARGVSATPRAAVAGARDLARASEQVLSVDAIARAYVYGGAAAATIERLLTAHRLPEVPRT